MLAFEVFDQKLQSAIKDALTKVNDLTIPFKLITQSWFKSNRAIFNLKGPGKYRELDEKYRERKIKKWGFDYPVLKASGKLSESITVPSDTNAVVKILNKKTLLLGSKISYGSYHQFGTKFMPARPWILVGAEQVAPPELNNRREAWIAVIQNFVLQKTQKSFGGP